MSSDAQALALTLDPRREVTAAVPYPSSRYLAGLDGLRGIAIVGVVVVHSLNGAPFASAVDASIGMLASFGWMGVDLFFVLSGFLITGILIEQRDRPAYFRIFFTRRALRILPAYVAFLAFALWVAPRAGAIAPRVAAQLRDTQGWYWTYLVNVMLVLHGWVADAPTHLWSLAVEEQFYLLWPFAVLALSPRALPRVALGCIFAASACRLVVVAAGAPLVANYVLLPTRMDTLALGAFLACAVRDSDLLNAVTRWRIPMVGLALVGLLSVAGIGHVIDAHDRLTQLLGFPAITVLAGSLVFGVSQSPDLFSLAPLRFLGRYSYGIYLWHWLAIAVLRNDTPLFQPRMVGGSYLVYYGECVVGALTMSLAMALVSWHVIEAPFLRLKQLFPYAGGKG